MTDLSMGDVRETPPPTPSLARSMNLAAIVVWATLTVMTLVALACIVRYGRNIPLAEDWLLVPPMTGHEPNLASWLWAQNNEHRLPLPRLVLLGLLEVTHDFRAGMVLNVLSLAALSAAMILTVRHLRGGITRVSDAFFPLALLHLGDWENLIWGWQFQFVSSAVLICALLLVIVRQRALGLLQFAGGCAVLALAIGWGRAATDMVSGMPMRYVVFAVPTLLASYFIWELYAPPRPRRWMQLALFVAMLALLPWNTREGFGLPGRYDIGWRGWYVTGMTAVEQDLRDGVPRAEMASRHREFLMHWDEAKLAAGMAMLRDAHIGPFSHLPPDR